MQIPILTFPLFWLCLFFLACQSTSPLGLPGLQDRQASTKFDSLPRKGSLSRSPWSSDYWANARGGVSLRWQAARIADEDAIEQFAPYRDYVPGQAPDKNLALLSPTEKLDLLRGDSKWTTTLNERKRSSAAEQDEWRGLNQAWAAASLRFDPVERVNIKSKNGVVLPFAADDVYALLTLAMHQKPPRPILLANRCGLGAIRPETHFENLAREVRKVAAEKLCLELSPAVFHATLVHQISKRDEGFILEGEQSSQPVTAYESRVAKQLPISAGSAPNTKKVLRIKTVVFYTSDTPVYSFDEDKSYPYETDTLVYDLDLDAKGDMIGGRWVDTGQASIDFKPDLLWKLGEVQPLDDLLQQIYDAARKSYLAGSHRLPDPLLEQPDDKREVLARFFGTGAPVAR